MHSTTVKLAWSIPVDIVEFGARLEAYYEVLDTRLTLQLCNRFGKGEKATVSKLPVELIEHIESCLIRDERARRRVRWRQDHTCWQGACKPSDHFLNNEEILDIYERGNNDPERLDRRQKQYGDSLLEAGEVNDWVLEEFAIVMEREWDDNGPHPLHEERNMSWHFSVGTPGKNDRGWFDFLGDILTDHFGLCAWIGHAECDLKLVTGFSHPSVHGSTIAYLHLPDEWSTEQQWRCRVYDWNEYDPADFCYPVGTEKASAVVPKIPSPPSEKSLERFARAIRILGLSIKFALSKDMATAEKKVDDAADARSEEHRSANWDGLEGEGPGENNDSKQAQDPVVYPGLRLLLVDKDNPGT